MLQTVNNKTMLTGKTYDFARNAALIYLPAFGTFYATIAGVWGLPASEQVVATIVAVDTLLGVLLRLSQKNYDESGAAHDGEIVPMGLNQDGQPIYKLNPTKGDLSDWADQSSVTLKVVPPVQPPTEQMNFESPPEPPQPPLPPAKP